MPPNSPLSPRAVTRGPFPRPCRSQRSAISSPGASGVLVLERFLEGSSFHHFGVRCARKSYKFPRVVLLLTVPQWIVGSSPTMTTRGWWGGGHPGQSAGIQDLWHLDCRGRPDNDRGVGVGVSDPYQYDGTASAEKPGAGNWTEPAGRKMHPVKTSKLS